MTAILDVPVLCNAKCNEAGRGIQCTFSSSKSLKIKIVKIKKRRIIEGFNDEGGFKEMSTLEKVIADIVAAVLAKEKPEVITVEKEPELKPTLNVVEAGAYLAVSKYTVINRIKEGKLRAYKQGTQWKIKREWLLDYERELCENT